MLLLRDGLPLFDRASGTRLSGYLLRWDASKAADAYRVISEFEPEHQYYWGETRLLGPSVLANVLVGRRPRQGSEPCEAASWSSKDDPVFSHGVREVRVVVEREGHKKFESAPPESFDWPRFFKLQMAYLLLWSAIERYTALSFGPDLDPWDRVKLLGEQALFKESLPLVVKRKDKLSTPGTQTIFFGSMPQTLCRPASTSIR